MQTVNFQCGHCGSLMAVSVEYLGQQVRCPTCQLVVIAPAATPPPAAPRESDLGGDIFTPAEDPESLFDAPEPPPLQLPPPPPPAAEETLPISPASRAAKDNGAATLPWDEPAESPTAGPAPLITDPPAEVVLKRGSEARSVGWFVPIVVLPLVLYALAATIAAGFLYSRWQPARPDLFDRMPDVEGDTPGVRKDRKRARLSFTPEQALHPLPAHLRVKLGDTLRVGDLEVTPARVERRKVGLLAESAPGRPEPSPNDALVLTLALKNLAEDYSFTPLDNYFDRAWKPGDESTPLTVLVAGKEAFFGGPARWYPRWENGTRRRVRQWLVGRKEYDEAGLAPGESAETVVATDGWDDKATAHLFGVGPDGQRVGEPYRGRLLWRVQLRRGLVTHKGRQVPATAVIGVEFDHTAYAKAG